MNIEESVSLYYRLENAVLVSPHGLRKRIAAGDQSFTLVDLRSREEYEEQHIVGAISIPAYRDRDTPAYGERQRFLDAFQKLPADKELILYCYSKACMSGKKVGGMLAEHGIIAKHLGVGWNEWRFAWQTWNHQHEWETAFVEDYLAAGAEPGQYQGTSEEIFACEC